MNKMLMLGVAALSMAVAMPAKAEPEHGGKKGKDLFAVHDTNSDGKVTKEEFVAGAEKKFTEMDTNKDGAISKEEHEARKAEWKKKMKEHREKFKDKPPVDPAE